MSDEQLYTALSEVHETNPDLDEQLKGASDLREVLAIFKEHGIETTQAEFMKAEARKLLEFSDAELEAITLKVSYTTDTYWGCPTWVFDCCPD